jgi:hypothetical protein
MTINIQSLITSNVRKVLVGVVLLSLIITIIGFQEQVPEEMKVKATSSSAHIYDKTFIPKINELVSVVPEGSVIVSSGYGPLVNYFTGYKTVTPHPVSTKDELVDHMRKKGYDYLLVFEGKSSDEEFKKLFSSKGMKSLNDDFELLASTASDFSKIHLYKLKDHSRISGKNYAGDNEWQVHTITEQHIADLGRSDMSTINAIKIRIADDGTGLISAWLNVLSLIDKDGNETVIEDFQERHGFKKVGRSGIQTDDTTDFVAGAQSLKLQTEGDGSTVTTRKLDILPSIDFTDKQLRVWVKVSDIDKLSEFRIAVSSDDFENYRNYWIYKPNK